MTPPRSAPAGSPGSSQTPGSSQALGSSPAPGSSEAQDVRLRVVPAVAPTAAPASLASPQLPGSPSSPTVVPFAQALAQPLDGSAAVESGFGWASAIAAAQDRVRAATGRTAVLLEELVTAASALVDAPVVVALLEGGRLVRRASTGGQERLLVGSVIDPTGTVCGAALASGRPQRAGAAVSPAGSGSCCPGAASHLVVPLVESDHVLGVLALTSEHDDWFDAGDEGRVTVLASVAARALGGVPTPREPLAAVGVPPDLAPSLHGLGMWSWDAGSGITTWSPSVADILGVQHDARLTLDHLRELIHPDDLPRFESAVTSQLAGAAGVAGTFRVRPQGRSERHVHAWAEVRRVGATVTGAWGAIVDVTEREKQAAALRSSLAGLRAAQELTGLGVWEWHPRDGRLEWSPEMFRIVGLEPGEVRPSLQLWHNFVHPEDLDRAKRLDALAGDADGGTVETFRVNGVDGVTRHVQSWSTVIPADGTSPRAVAGATVDVSRQVRDRVLLEHRSSTDPVTGLANRLGFDRRVQELLDSRTGDVALLLLDLDRFKLVNDSLGHQVGDRLLIEVARRLERVVPDGSITARMGGDEFVVVPPSGLDWLELRDVAKNVVDALRAPFELNNSGEVLVCPASVGMTTTAGRGCTVDELLSEADLALYRAKDSGRDRFVVFDDALRERARGRHRAEKMLRAALEEKGLLLEYQPIVDFTHGQVVGAEALVRMRAQGSDELLAPDTFVDVAEDTGLVVELDCWVIGSAIAQLAQWIRNAPPGRVPWLAVNVSPRSMEHPRLVGTLIAGLREYGVPPHLLKVELTEHSFLSTLPGGEASLRQLIASGVPVGIDDFGTGYSALAYLPRFRLDFMKIDRSFVMAVGQESRADAVVTAIVQLAHAHDMKVTAEGIETARQVRFLRDIKCDFAQGYYFGRPGDASRILRGYVRV